MVPLSAVVLPLRSRRDCTKQDPFRKEGELIRKIVATAVKGGFAEVEEEINSFKGEIKGVINEVKVEVEGGFDDTKTELRDVKDEVEGGFGDTVTGLRDVQQEVKDGFDTMQGSLDKVLESTQESLVRLKDLQAPNYRYPRLVVVKQAGISGRSSKVTGWKRFLPSNLRGLAKKDMTLHFLCPVDMTKRCRAAMVVAVVTAKVALKATTGLKVDISDFLKDVKDGLVEELVDRTLDEDALLRAVLGRDGDGYIDFREEMKRLTNGRGGMVWVRNDNVQKWLDLHATAAPTR
ncbi:unnamed protein product [Ectocarpus sp. CCAP 1310/34]|nr:unnamed protein product [Ectocarpus sp. CCAP 1310/34]